MIVFMWIIALLFVAGIGWNGYLRWRVYALRTSLHASGWPITLKEIDSRYVLPPGAANAADDVAKAIPLICTYDPKDFTRKANAWEAAVLRDIPQKNLPLTDELKNRILERQEKYREALGYLRHAAEIVTARYAYDFTKWPEGWKPDYLKTVREGVYLLCEESILRADAGAGRDAVASFIAACRLTATLNNDPTLTGQLVRRANLGKNLVRTLRYVLGRCTTDREDLRRMRDAVALLDVPEALKAWLPNETCMVLSGMTARSLVTPAPTMTELRPVTPPLQPPPPPPSRPWILAQATAIKCMGFDQLVRIDLLKQVDRAMNILKQPPERGFPMQQQFRKDAMLHPAMSSAIPSTGGLFCHMLDWSFSHTAYLRILLTTLSIEGYRADHGQLPDTLDALVPEYEKTAPLDPYDGQLLRYKKTPKGYVVYSIGPDGKDNNGALEDPTSLEDTDLAFLVVRAAPGN